MVVLIIDQLPGWSFDRDRPHLKGGLGRLLAEGTLFTDVRFPYASTFTAPGHAAIATGASPAVTGIVGNAWYRPEVGRVVETVRDTGPYPVFGVASGDGVSSALLRVDGLAEALAGAHGSRAKSISLSLKDRSAVLALGRRPTLAAWYESSLRRMTTSRFYATEVPAWLVASATQERVTSLAQEVWTPLDPALLGAVTMRPDAGVGEGGTMGLGSVFPHRPAETPDPYATLLATPGGHELLVDVGLAAVTGERLGEDAVPDLLALSFSSHDYAGHAWGQESWERLDILLRLDRAIARLLTGLDASVGVGRYAVVVTSDHGAVPLVEETRKRGLPAFRVSVTQVMTKAKEAAKSVVGDETVVVGATSPTVYLAPRVRELPAERRRALLDAISQRVAEVEGIAWAKPTEDLLGDCARREESQRLACMSLDAERSGEVYFSIAPLSVVGEGSTGTSHGTASLEDRRVPVVVFAPKVYAAASVRTQPLSMLQVAPTIASLAGAAAPAKAEAEALPVGPR